MKKWLPYIALGAAVWFVFFRKKATGAAALAPSGFGFGNGGGSGGGLSGGGASPSGGGASGLLKTNPIEAAAKTASSIVSQVAAGIGALASMVRGTVGGGKKPEPPETAPKQSQDMGTGDEWANAQTGDSPASNDTGYIQGGDGQTSFPDPGSPDMSFFDSSFSDYSGKLAPQEAVISTDSAANTDYGNQNLGEAYDAGNWGRVAELDPSAIPSGADWPSNGGWADGGPDFSAGDAASGGSDSGDSSWFESGGMGFW